MKLSNKYLPYLALTLAAIIWGANTPIMKYTLSYVPVFSLAFLRFFGAALLLLPFVYPHLSLKKSDLFHIFLSAFLGITVTITLFFVGLQLTTAINSGIIGGTLPIVMILFAYLFLHEKLTRKMLIGTLIGLLGLCVIVGKDLLLQGFAISPLGDTIILLSNVSFAAYATLSKELSKRYTTLAFTFLVFSIGSMFFLPGVFLEFQSNPDWYQTIPLQAYLGLLYGILFSALIAFALWQYGLSKIAEAKVGFFLYVSPIVSTILAVLFLGEMITEEFLIGTLLIFIGLFIAEAHIHHKRPHHH